MARPKSFVHSYIPNSNPEIKRIMLKEIGAESTEELYKDIPKNLIYKKKLSLPKPSSEYQVKRHITSLLAKNKTSHEMPTFIGAGTWPHYIPAVCDEINGRAELLTSYAGDTYSDLGRYQAIFEFASMIGELFSLYAVSWPMYDWATCCGEAARMASRITDRYEVLVPKIMCPERLSVLKNYVEGLMDINFIGFDSDTGQLDLEDLVDKISSKTAAVYIENPSYLGFVEAQGEEVSKIAHENGSLSIVGVEPTSLGVLTPPGEYGADIAIGDAQPLGCHMNYGGGVAGIIACRDEEDFLAEMPSLLCCISTTQHKGEYGYSWFSLPDRLHYFTREKGKSFTGTSGALWGITAAVYMALLGPHGMRELGEAIMQKSHYAIKRISEVKGINVPLFNSTHFEEFTVNFDETDRGVDEVNKALLKHGIQGGKDVTKEFPDLGKNSLFCVTEVHTKGEIDRLVNALKESIE